MKRRLFCILLLLTASAGLTKSQISGDETAATLEKLFGRLSSATEDSTRLRINDSIKFLVENYIATDKKIFSHTFSNLRYLGQIVSFDSLIKILSWNLVLANEPGRYFCYFIKRSSDGNPNRVYSLTRSYDKDPILTDNLYSESDWYGALYYDIRPFFTGSTQCWVLLGISYSDRMITRKVIDVLSFTPEDKIQFGKKWFASGGSLSFRHVLEYSASAIISLRFRSDNTIVFDHLVLLPSAGQDDRLYYGPDYSYDAFTFKDGIWSLSVNIDARNKEK